MCNRCQCNSENEKCTVVGDSVVAFVLGVGFFITVDVFVLKVCSVKNELSELGEGLEVTHLVSTLEFSTKKSIKLHKRCHKMPIIQDSDEADCVILKKLNYR